MQDPSTRAQRQDPWLARDPVARWALALFLGVRLGLLGAADPGPGFATAVALGLLSLRAELLGRGARGRRRAAGLLAWTLWCCAGWWHAPRVDPTGGAAAGGATTPGATTPAAALSWPPPRAVADPGRADPGEVVQVLDRRRVVRSAAAPGARPELLRVELGPEHVRRLAERPPCAWDPLTSTLRAARDAARARLARLPDPATSGLARALVIGDREGLPPGLADRFTRTGTRHLLALSGLHVGLVVLVVAAPLAGLARRVARRRAGRGGVPAWVGPATQALLLFLLVALGGGGAPILRAAVALGLAAAALELPRIGPGRRSVRGTNLWGVGLTLELLLQPAAALDLGLLLSYGATLALLCATRGALLRAATAWPGRLRAVDPLGRPRPGYLVVPLQRAVDGLRGALVASVVAVLGTLPVTWTVFGEVAPAGVLLTPLMLPAVAVLVIVGWLHVLSWGILGGALLDVSARALLVLLEVGDRIPATPLPLPARPEALVLVAALTTLATWRAPRGGGRVLGRVACATWAALLVPWCPGPAGLEVVAVDVGHGTAVLWRAPGSGVWVVDAGSRDRTAVGPTGLAPVLARWEAGAVTVVATHRDADHVGALDWLRTRHALLAWHGAAPAAPGGRDADVPLGSDLERGTVPLGGGGSARVELLRGQGTGDNEGSRSLLVRADGASVLLTGDAEDLGWWGLFERDLPTGPLQLLLLPHHGADAPALPELLDRTRPGRVWISGSGPQGAEELLDRLGLPWEATWRDGALEFRSRGTKAWWPGGNPAEEDG